MELRETVRLKALSYLYDKDSVPADVFLNYLETTLIGDLWHNQYKKMDDDGIFKRHPADGATNPVDYFKITQAGRIDYLLLSAKEKQEEIERRQNSSRTFWTVIIGVCSIGLVVLTIALIKYTIELRDLTDVLIKLENSKPKETTTKTVEIDAVSRSVVYPPNTTAKKSSHLADSSGAVLDSKITSPPKKHKKPSKLKLKVPLEWNQIECSNRLKRDEWTNLSPWKTRYKVYYQ